MSLLAFLWPPKGQVGFGGVFDVGKEDEIKKYFATSKAPWYAPAARTYVQPYPDDKAALDKAQAVYKPNDELSFALSARYQGKIEGLNRKVEELQSKLNDVQIKQSSVTCVISYTDP